MVSAVDRAKRALVSLLLRLSKPYSVVLEITRDAADADIRRSFKKVSRKTHPDRGGSGEHQQSLNDTYAAWEKSQRDAKERGRGRQRSTTTSPHDASSVLLPLRAQAKSRKDFRFQSAAVLLTYQRFQTSVWEDFVANMKEYIRHWKAKFWCATMETNTDSTFHLHLALQFHASGAPLVMEAVAAQLSIDGRPVITHVARAGGRKQRTYIRRATT